MWTDRVTRLDPKTSQFTDYLLPRETNIRRVFVDNTTSPVDLLGRQQSRRVDSQTGTARLFGVELKG